MLTDPFAMFFIFIGCLTAAFCTLVAVMSDAKMEGSSKPLPLPEDLPEPLLPPRPRTNRGLSRRDRDMLLMA